MAKQSSVIKGLVVAIIPAVVIYWCTQGFPWAHKDATPDPATSLVGGRVMDATKLGVLEGAVVVLSLPGEDNPPDTTDSYGRYLFIVAKPSKPVAAKLSVQAQGYTPRSYNATLDGLKDLDIQLQPLTPGLAAPPAANTAVLPKVNINAIAAGVAYKPRAIATAVRIGALKK